MEHVKILLIDNSVKVREGLRHLLDTFPNIKIVGECGDGIEVIPFLKKNKVDVIFIDLLIKTIRGTELIKKIKELPDDIKIIVFSINDSQRFRDKVLSNGADAFISKIDFTKQEIFFELSRVTNNSR